MLFCFGLRIWEEAVSSKGRAEWYWRGVYIFGFKQARMVILLQNIDSVDLTGYSIRSTTTC